MVKIEMHRKAKGTLLVIWECANGDLIGEVFNNGIEKRGKWDMKARFRVKDNEATTHRVCEYFGFDSTRCWWRRWA